MLTSPTNLKDTLLALDNDVGGLPGRRVSLLGFRDPNAQRVADNVRALCETPNWTVVDLRNDSNVRLPGALIQSLAAAKLAVLVDVTRPLANDVTQLIRALYDARDAVRWTDGTQTPLPTDRMLHVIAVGARVVDELPALLQTIDFMKFIKGKARTDVAGGE